MKIVPLLLIAVLLAGCSSVPGGGGQAAQVDWFAWHARGPGGAPLAPVLKQTLSGTGGTPFDVAPKAFDLNGDGKDELIAQGNDTNVYVFDSQTGKVLAKLPTTTPRNWYVERVLNAVEAGVMRPGEPASIVVVSHAAYLSVYRYEPSKSTATAFEFTRTSEMRLDQCHFEPSADARPALADVDGDGSLEIAAQTEESGLFVVKADGKVLWKRCWAGGNASPFFDDLDGDGSVEAIFASDGGQVSVLNGKTGETVYLFDARQHLWPASIPTAPAVAELDGQSPKELVFTARHAGSREPKDFPNYHMAIFAIHGSAGGSEMLWMRQPEWANPLSYTRIQAADVDGDGQSDIFGMDWNTIGHKPGNWETLNRTNLFRLDGQGNDVWVRNVTAWWSNKDILLADGDADGDLDVLANGEQLGFDGIYRFSAATGEEEGFLPAAGYKVLRGPQIVDLRHDGGRQVILPVATVTGRETGAILVIEIGKGGLT